MTGITRESVTLTMKEFQTKHVIRHPRVTVLEIHHERLEELTQQ